MQEVVSSSNLNEASSLGSATMRYESSIAKGDILLTLTFCGLGMFFASLLIRPNPQSTEALLFTLAVAIILLFIAAVRVYIWAKNRGVWVQVYSDGLARKQGAKTQSVRWDDIVTVWQSVRTLYINGGHAHTAYKCTLKTADQRKIIFGNEITAVQQLGAIIQSETTKRLLPQILTAFNAGQSIPFGQFTVTPNGVNHKNKLLSWAEIEDVQIRNGYLSFRQQDEWSGWIRVSASKIPNVLVFLSLIQHIIQTKNAFADTQLGNLQVRYHGNQGTNTSILMGGVMCALGVVAIIAAFADWGQIAVMLVYFVFAGFLFRYGGRTLLQWWKNRGVVVHIYDEGFVRVKGDEKLRVMWDDIRAVWLTGTNHYYVNSAYTGTSFVYTVEINNNQRFAFGDEILDITTLGETIQEQVRERLFPRLLAAYEKGETLVFGSVSLNKEGIDHKNKSLAWAEIEGVKVVNGYIAFKQQGSWLNWANISLDQIPNMSTFLTLIDHIVGLRRGVV